jgi:hypothetical protein
MSTPQFRSEFKFHPQLRACLVDDRAHIGLTTLPAKNRRGFHILLIKKALMAFVRRLDLDSDPPGLPDVIPILDLTNLDFDEETAELVEIYKELHKPRLLNAMGKIDRIVGKKTIAALDKELPRVD